MGTQTVRSEDLQPGTKVRYNGNGKVMPHVVTLDRRKTRDDERNGDLPFHPGWWLCDDAGGLADSVIDADDSDWTVLG